MFKQLEIITKKQGRDAELVPLQDAVKSINQVTCSQQEKLVDLEDRSRRDNMIVFGIPEQEQERETDEIIRKKVIQDLFRGAWALMYSR